MNIDRFTLCTVVAYRPAVEFPLEILSNNTLSAFSFYDNHVMHVWDYVQTEHNNPDDPAMGQREQRYTGSQTVLRNSISEVSMRPYLENDITEDDYADGQWMVLFYTNTGSSWKVMLEDESQALALYEVFHKYITDHSKLP